MTRVINSFKSHMRKFETNDNITISGIRTHNLMITRLVLNPLHHIATYLLGHYTKAIRCVCVCVGKSVPGFSVKQCFIISLAVDATRCVMDLCRKCFLDHDKVGCCCSRLPKVERHPDIRSDVDDCYICKKCGLLYFHRETRRGVYGARRISGNFSRP